MLPTAPRLETAGRADVAVIGGGLTGLNAALELVERHGADVAVLDAGQPGWGASGRNGGFVCMGGARLSDQALVRRVGAEGARAFHRFQQQAVAEVDANLARYGIDADRGPDGEVCLAHRAGDWQALQDQAADRARLFGDCLQLLPRAALAEAGLGPAEFQGAAINPVGFPIQPLKYTAGLARAALAAGVRLWGDSPVTGLSPEAGGWRLATPLGTVRARRVLVATNGYTSDDIPGWIGGRTLPVLSSILVTRPLTTAEREAQGWTSLAMSYDTRRLLHYFRLLPDGRFLFGMRGGLSALPEAQQRLRAEATRHFRAMFPAWRAVEIERFWSGLACLTGSRTPFAGAVPGADGLFAAFGWHGNGVATGTLAGRMVARSIAGAPNPAPALMQMPPARVPLPRLRRLWLRAAYMAYGLADGPLR